MSNLQAPKPAAKNEAESSISLGEGQKPLLLSRHIGPSVGLSNLYFKLETVNPSGSYKDRFAAAAISLMLKEGKKRCLATLSGNTGSALAAYCAAAGMSCEIVILETTPNEKLKQMAAYGAKLFKVRGFGPQPDVTQRVSARLQQMGNCGDCALQIGAYCYSPGGMAGIETISSELAAQLSSGIDHVCVPAGGGGLTLSIARGFERLPSGFSRPRIHCVQPEGNDTIASAIRSGASKARSVTCTTKISGLQVSNVLDGNEVIAACRKSGGNGYLVTDIAVWEMQPAWHARREFSASRPRRLPWRDAQRICRGRDCADERVVCIVTGIGFKDLHAIDKITANSQCPVLELSQFEEMLR